MADTSSCPGMTVYRLRVVIAGISPLIWRRLEVAAGTTVAGRTPSCRPCSAGVASTCTGSLSAAPIRFSAASSGAVRLTTQRSSPWLSRRTAHSARSSFQRPSYGASGSMPGDVAWTRSRRPGLASIRPTWTLTVPSHRCSSVAISRSESPTASWPKSPGDACLSAGIRRGHQATVVGLGGHELALVLAGRRMRGSAAALRAG
jgi:hypothetical protein